MDFGSFGAGFGSFGTTGGATLPEFIGAAGAGNAPVSTGGGNNDGVNHKTNGVYELKTDAHGRTGYVEGYYWHHLDLGSPNYRILKKTDGTWGILDQNTVRYTNSDTGSVPPASGWVTESAGTAPPPTLLFNVLITEQTSVALTNCALVSRDYGAGEITLKSTVASGTKVVEFGDATGISDGDLYAVGYQTKDDGTVTGSSNVRFGQTGVYVRASSLWGGSTSYRGEAWQQEFGKDRAGADDTIDTSVGLQFSTFGSGWATDEEITIKKLRVMVA
jgi:hypothetical protein